MTFRDDFEKMVRDRVETQKPSVFTIIGAPGSGKTTFARNCAQAFKSAALYPGEIKELEARSLENTILSPSPGLVGHDPKFVSPLSKSRGFAIIDEIHNARRPFLGQTELLLDSILNQTQKSGTELVLTAYPDAFKELIDDQPGFASRIQGSPILNMDDADADVDLPQKIIEMLRKDSAARQVEWLTLQRKRDIERFLKAPAGIQPAAAPRFKLPVPR